MLPDVIAREALSALRGAGIVDARLGSIALSPGRLALTGFRAGPEGAQTIAVLEADWSLDSLMAGRVLEVRLSGLRLEVTVTADGTVIVPGYGTIGGAGGTGGGLPGLPFDRLVLEDAEVGLDTPAGRFTLVGGGRLDPDAAAWRIALKVEARARGVSLPLDLGVEVAADGGFALAATVPEGRAGRYAVAGLVARRIDGVLSWRQAPAAAPELEVGLALGGLVVAGLPVERLDLELSTEASPGGVRLSANAEGVLGGAVTLIARLPGLGPENGALSLALQAHDLDAARLLPRLGIAPPLGAVLAPIGATLRLEGEGPGLAGWRNPLGGLIASRLEAQLGLHGAGLALPGIVEAGTADLTATVTVDQAAAEIRGAPLLTLSGRPPAGAVALPDDLAARAEAGVSLRFGAPAEPARLRLSLDEGGAVLSDLAGPVLATGAGGRVALRLERLQPLLEDPELPLEGLEVTLPPLSLGGLALAGGLDAATVRLGAGGLEVTGDLDLRLAGPLADGVIVHDGRVSGPIHLNWAGERLTLKPTQCLAIDSPRIAATGVEITGLRGLCLAAREAETPLLALALDDPAGLRVRLDAASGPWQAAARLPGAVDLSLRAGATTVTIGLGPQGLRQLTAALGVVGLSSEGLGLVAEGGRLEVTLDERAPLRFAATLDPLRQAAPAPVIAPGRLTVTGTRDAEGAIAASAGFEIGVTRVTAQIRHDAASGRGKAELVLPRTLLGPGFVDLHQISPRIPAFVQDIAGELAVEAHLRWGTAAPDAQPLAGEAVVEISKGAFTSFGYRVSGVSGRLATRQVWPPALPPGQRITFAVETGFGPVTEGLASFGISPDGILALGASSARWGGGRLRVDPLVIDLNVTGARPVLSAEGVDVAFLFGELLALDGLSGTGQVSGRLPISVAKGLVAIDEGVLTTTAPGVIRYDPAEPPTFLSGNAQLELVAAILRDFHYDRLSVEIDGVLGQPEQRVVLRLDGANPDVYGGKRVELNVNLSGALEAVLRQQLENFQGGRPDVVDDLIDRYRGATE